jgi:AcrR family transcriptional regulator
MRRSRTVLRVDDQPGSAAPRPGGRAALLERLVAHLAEAGAHDVTLRGLAAAVGTSHRMLIYHFGTIDGLITAVVAEVEERQRTALSGLVAESDAGLEELAELFWRHARAPELRELERLFFELYGRLVRREGRVADELLVAPWLDAVGRLGVARGYDARTSRALARLGTAVTRGLLLDLLATEDEEGVDEAHRLYARLLGSLEPPPGAP